mgnify:CR=1 FL=1
MMIFGVLIVAVGEMCDAGGGGGNKLSKVSKPNDLSSPEGGRKAVVLGLGVPSLAKAREASISISRSKLDKVSRVVAPACGLVAVSTLLLELEAVIFGDWGGLIEGLSI